MIKAIITGVTGMIGEGVLYECLKSEDVDSVLVITRKPTGLQHEKLVELVHADFSDLSPVKDQLGGFNACYFCAGVTSMGKSEKEYTALTYDLTLHFANTLLELNPEMIFNYVTGAGTDSSEKGRSMWARVKGKTENDLMKLPFKASYMFRPGYIQPIKGLKNTNKFYKVFAPFYPIWKTFFPKFVCTLEDIGQAMIKSVNKGFNKRVLECKDITKLANS